MSLPSWAALLLSSRRRQQQDGHARDGLGRSTDVRLQLTHLEDRRVLNGAPVAVQAGVGGDHHASTVDVVLKGDQLSVFVDSTLVRVEALEDVSSLEIDGDPDGTTLTLDFTGGDPTPSGGIDFKGAGDSADDNTLQLKPGADASLFGSVAYFVSGTGVSSISLTHTGNATTSTITLSGVANVQDSLSADHRSFDITDNAVDATLAASPTAGSEFSQLITTFGTTVLFDNPHSSLNITSTNANAAATNSTLHLSGLGSNFDADLSVAGFGTVRVDAASDVGSGHIAIAANEVDVFAPLRSTGPAAEIVAQQLINVSSSGSVTVGDGGSIRLAAPKIDNSGLLSALGGNITLDASGGTLWVSGAVDASDLRNGATGGRVELLGDYVGVLAGANIDASGNAGGGVVLVGGDLHGQDSTHTATRTYIDADATIRADAIHAGTGGEIVVWSNEATYFYGSITARGGELFGGGGYVEVSSHDYLDFHGAVDLEAISGPGGNLLLDPDNIVLSTGPENPLFGGLLSPFSYLFGTNPGGTTTLDVTALIGSFAAVTNNATITLEAQNSITVSNAFNVALATGAANVSLILHSHGTITVNAPITTAAAMTLQTDGVSAGLISINSALQAGGTLTISGKGVTDAVGATITGNIVTIDAGGQAADLKATVTSTGVTTIHDASTVKISGVSATTLSLGTAQDVTGAVTQYAATGLGVSTLNVSTAGSVTLTNSGNQIGTLGSTTTGGALSIVDSTALNVSAGTNSGASATSITAGGLLTINGNVGVTGNNAVSLTGVGVTLSSGKTVSSGSGAITIDGGAAAISLLGDVSTTGNVTVLHGTTASLNNISAATLTLGVAQDITGAVTQNALTALTVTNLFVSTAGAVTLNNSGNQITTLGAATTGGALSIIDSTALTITGPTSSGANATSITASGLLTVNGNVADTGNNAITLTGVGIAQGAASTISSGSGAITLDGGASAIALSGGVSTTGNVSIHHATTVGLGNVSAATFNLGSSLDVTGAVTQNASTALNVTTLVVSTASAVTLTRTTNQISTLGGATSGGALSIVDSSALTVTGPTSSGANATSLSAGGLLTVNGNVAVTGNNTVTLIGIGITQGAASTISSGSGTITLDGGASAIAISGGMSTTGDVSIHHVTTVGLGNISANTFNLGSAQDITGAVTQNAATALTIATLVVSTAGSVALNGMTNQIATLGSATSAALTIVDSTALTITGPTNSGANTTSIVVGGLLTINGNVAATGNNAIDLTGVGITQGAASTISSGSGAITLDGGAAAIALSGGVSTTGNVSIHHATTVGIGNVTANMFTLGSAQDVTGAVTQNAATSLNVSTLVVSTANAVTLNNTTNQISTLGAATTAGALSIVDSTALIITGPTNSGANATSIAAGGLLTVNGNVATTGNNTIDLTGVGIAQGAASTVSSGSGTITLDGGASAIAISGGVGTTGDVSIHHATTVDLGNTTANTFNLGSTLDVTGAVTQNAATALNVATLVVSTTGSVALTKTTNQIGTLGSATSGALTIVDSTALTITGPTNSGANATSITAGGLLTVNDNIAVTGNNTIDLTGLGIIQSAASTISSGSGAITLDGGAAAIALPGDVNTTGDVSIHHATTVGLGDVSANLLSLGTAQDITGAATQNAATSLNVSTLVVSTAGAVTLTEATNQIATLGSATTGGALSIVDATALIVTGPTNSGASATSINAGGLLKVNGNVTVTSNNTIDLTGVGITQAIASTISSGSGVVTLDSGDSAIALSGGVSTTGNVSIHHATTVGLGNVTANTFNLGTSQDITGAVTQSLATALNVATLVVSTAGSVALTATANQISTLGAATIDGSLSLVDSTALAITGPTNSGAHATAITAGGLLTVNGSVAVTGNNTIDLTGVGITQAAASTISSGSGAITLDGGAASIALSGKLNTTGNVTVHHATTVGLGDISTATLNLGSSQNVTGAVTQNAGTTITATSLIISTADAVTLTNATNQFTTLGAATTGGALSLVTSTILTVTGPTTSGTHTTAITAGGLLTINGNVAVTGNNTIDLTGLGITQGAASNISSGSGAITIDGGAAAIAMSGSASSTGVVNIHHATTLALGNVSAGSFDLGSAQDVTGAVTQNASTAIAATSLVVSTAGAVTLANTGNTITAIGATTTGGALNVHSSTAMAVNGPVSVGDHTIQLTSGGLLLVNTGLTTTSSDITLKGVGVTQLVATAINAGAGSIEVDGGGGAIALAGSLTTTAVASAVTIHDAAGVTFNSIQTAGNLLLGVSRDISGLVTQTGALQANALDLSGTATFTLANPSNQFNTLAANVTGNVTLVDSVSVNLGAVISTNVAVDGIFTLTAGGDITQSAQLGVTGATQLTLSAANSNIALASQPNDLKGLVTVANNGNAHDVSLRNTNALAVYPIIPTSLHNLTLIFDAAGVVLPTAVLTGNLTLNVNGDVTQVAATSLTVTGTTNVSAGAAGIAISGVANSFQGAVSLANSGAHDVNVWNSTALVLGQVNVGTGTLTLRGIGVSETVAIAQPSGSGAVNITSTGGAIALGLSNDFTGLVSLVNSGAFDITLVDINNLSLGTVHADVGNINIASAADMALQSSNITTTAGSITLASLSGAMNMGSSGVVHSVTGDVHLAGRNGVTLGVVSTTSNAFVDSIAGSIVDGGAAGPAIIASGAALHATTGIGVGTPLQTAVKTLAASTPTGVLQVSNDLGGTPLTIGNVGSMSGVQSSGSQVTIDNAGSLVVDAGVFNTGGGSIALRANGSIADDLAINQPVRATGGSGSVSLTAAGNVVMTNPSGANPLIQVTGGGQIVVSAGGAYVVGSNVVLQSGTGKATAPAPTITDVVIPQISSFGVATVTALFGPGGESNVSLTVDWHDGTTSTATVATLANVLFEHQYFGHPGGTPSSADPISITIIAHNDPNIIFAGANQIVVQTQAATPGTGLAVFFIDLTPQPPALNTFVYRVDAAPQTMISSLVSAPTTEVITAPNEVKTIEVRELVLNVIAPDGTVQPVPLPIEVLDDLPSLFKQLPDGRYRLQLTEPGSSQSRVVIDVELRDGRPFDPADESDGLQDRPPSSDAAPAAAPNVIPTAPPVERQSVVPISETLLVEMPLIELPAVEAIPAMSASLGWLESTIVGGVGVTIAMAGCEAQRSETRRTESKSLGRGARLLRRWKVGDSKDGEGLKNTRC